MPWYNVILDITDIHRDNWEEWCEDGNWEDAMTRGIDLCGTSDGDRELWRVMARNPDSARRKTEREIARSRQGVNVRIHSIEREKRIRD